MLSNFHFLKNLGKAISKNSPYILTGLGCAGLMTTAILSGKAAVRAEKILQEHDEERTFFGDLKVVWKIYIPTGIVGLTSIGCIIGANSINLKRNTALAALYSISETALLNYQEKVVEEIGKNKELKIRDNVAKDLITNNPPEKNTIILTGNGDVICYDRLSDRYFKSSIEIIRQKVNELNKDLLTDMWLSLNDLYYALGLPSTGLGEQVGFDLDKGLIEIDYSSQLSPDGTPCLAIDTKVYPKYFD